MSQGTLTKVTVRTAAEVCRACPMGDDAKKLLREGQSPRAYLDELLAKKLYPDAARFLAHALPPREAVWWACVCVRQAQAAGTDPQAVAALQLAERWASDPTDANRRAAFAAAEAAGIGTPAGCAGAAAFFSGGSVAPPNIAEVKPVDYATAKAVAGAIMLAVVQKEPQKMGEKYAKSLALGIDVANGVNRWKER